MPVQFNTKNFEQEQRTRESAKNSRYSDMRSRVKQRQIEELERLGILGAKFLDSQMTRDTMKGWASLVDDKKMSVTWFHPSGNDTPTQMGVPKEGVTVNDVIRFLNYGTNPSYGPVVKKFLWYYGKYAYAGKGNAFDSEGNPMFKMGSVKGITAQNFLHKVLVYATGQTRYARRTAEVYGETIEFIFTGKLRRGFTRDR